MQKIELGDTGIAVSRLGLGTTKFGRNQGVKYPHDFDLPDEADLADLLAVAKDLGVNLIDTAPAYGLSEERLGRLLTGQRDDWVIVGKVGEEFEGGVSSHNFTPDHFEMSLQRSLRRLRTDTIDVLLIHSDGNDLAILENEDLIRTLEDFKRRGLVRAIGASTKTAAGGIKTLEVMDVVMATYNPQYTDEKPVLDYAAAHNKGVLLKKALSSGHDTDIDSAMAFAFAHDGVNAVITGTINPAHLRENVEAASRF
ncbi:MAG: aldo/keto reductase [Bdellovibrionales bacterium]